MKFDRVMEKNQYTFSVVGNDLFLAAVENTQINLDDDTVVYAVESSTSRPGWTGVQHHHQRQGEKHQRVVPETKNHGLRECEAQTALSFRFLSIECNRREANIQKQIIARNTESFFLVFCLTIQLIVKYSFSL